MLVWLTSFERDLGIPSQILLHISYTVTWKMECKFLFKIFTFYILLLLISNLINFFEQITCQVKIFAPEYKYYQQVLL